MIGANGWIAGDSWRSGDYTALVAETSPEALANAPGGVIRVTSSHPQSGPAGKHSLVSLVFGWETALTEFETWAGLFAMGPLGFARISGRPQAAAALLAHNGYMFDPYTARSESGLSRLAGFLANVYEPPQGADTATRPDRWLHKHSGLLEQDDLDKIDRGDSFARIVPTDPRDWAALKLRLIMPTAEITRHHGVLRFTRMDPTGDGHMRFTILTVEIEHRTRSLAAATTDLGTLACTAAIWPIVGRPFEVAGTRRCAAPVHRSDWC